MNRHSIFFYIGVFYLFLFCVVNWLFYSQVRLNEKEIIAQAIENANDAKRFYADKYIKKNFLSPHEKSFEKRPLPPFDMQKKDMRPLFGQRPLEDKPPKKRPLENKPPAISMEATEADKKVLFKLFSLEMLERNDTKAQTNGKKIFQKPDLRVYTYKEWVYIYDYGPDGEIGATFRYKNKSHVSETIYTAILVNITILIFVLLVMSKILPIRKLHKSMIRFAKGNLNVRSNITGKDEIAEVAQTFDTALEKIQSLQSSRNLFMRNIMHELKTPIAKGKMITSLMDDEKNSERLNTILNRFEYLLGEFTKIEQVTSNEFTLKRKKYKNIDILENAIDILMIIEDDIDINCKHIQKLDVDFELFSIVLKNLIDNAIKYGHEKPEVILDKGKISIISKSDEIKDLDFEKVFKRSFEDSNTGLGLGLYITYNIVKKHGYELKYLHENGKNHFIILT